MTQHHAPQQDPRAEQVLDVLMRIASGDLDARLEPRGDADELHLIMTALNMLAEELQASVGSERKLLESLEEKVAQRTAQLEAKMKVIGAQSRTIRELSTPVLQVWNEILVMPLIGIIDTKRAQQVMENLLDTIVKNQATVAILDITGVPVVDTTVANHLLLTASAAKTLGAEVMLTGVSPHNARTLTKVGVDLGKITTKGSLQRGLEAALEVTGHKVAATT